MIKNKEKLKQELKEKMNQEIDNYVDAMEQGFCNESFPIGEIEKLWGKAINNCNSILHNGTEEMLNSVCETELISKKKEN